MSTLTDHRKKTPGLAGTGEKANPATGGYNVRRWPTRQDATPLTGADVAEILAYVPTRPSYPEWIAIIAAVGSVLDVADAAAVLCAWSAEESPGEYARKLRTRCQRIGIGSLIQQAKQNGFDAKAFARRRADRSAMPRRVGATAPKVAIAQPVAKAEPRPPMPEEVAHVWVEGVAHLRTHPATVSQVDAWRGWPAGTSATLVEDGLLSSPVIYGKRGLAFPVQAPERCELGIVQTRQIGFHVRHKPQPGERVVWSYSKQDARATPALPFVIGAGFASLARTVIICEGQWDAITLAAAAGWLASDAAWPEHVVLFGARGAGGWRVLWDHWRPFLPRGVAFVLFPDADEAGARWTAPRGFRDTLAAAGHSVRIVRSEVEGAKDLNDLHRLVPLTAEEIGTWLGKGGRA